MQITITFDTDKPGDAAALDAIQVAVGARVAETQRKAPGDPAMADLKQHEQPNDLKPAESPVPTLDQVQEAVRNVFASKGEEGTRQLLARFKATGASSVLPDQRSDFLRAAKEAMS